MQARPAPGPILFLDSGIGGLSVLAAVRRALPDAPLVYCADSAGFPYGTRTEAEIATRVPALLGRLVERVHPSIIVIACNTASTIALPHVRAALDLPVVGTVPAIKPAAERSKTRVIGVLGTRATVRQPYVDDLSARFAADCTVLRHGSAELVEAAEAKLHGKTPDPAIFRAAIEGLAHQPGGDRIDVIVLACTHFPLVAEELAEAARALLPGRPVSFVDGAEGIARRTAHLLSGLHWPAPAPPGRAIFTGGTESVAPYRPALKAFGIETVESL